MAARFASARSRYLVPFDGTFRIRRASTRPPHSQKTARANEEALADAIQAMRKLQSRLLANDRRALLVVFQALDAAGKDGTIKAVMSGINPAGCEVHGFKKPSEDDLDHDFLWRVCHHLPERGRIGIFNRSHYEEVLVVKVHPDILDAQRLPEMPAASKLWKERYESIRDFEKHLARNGTTILKFFLNVSKGEQRRRLLDCIDRSGGELEIPAARCAGAAELRKVPRCLRGRPARDVTTWAPWYAVPADDKEYMRRIVAEVIVDTLRAMDLRYPVPDRAGRLAMAAAKKALQSEK